MFPVRPVPVTTSCMVVPSGPTWTTLDETCGGVLLELLLLVEAEPPPPPPEQPTRVKEKKEMSSAAKANRRAPFRLSPRPRTPGYVAPLWVLVIPCQLYGLVMFL